MGVTKGYFGHARDVLAPEGRFGPARDVLAPKGRFGPARDVLAHEGHFGPSRDVLSSKGRFGHARDIFWSCKGHFCPQGTFWSPKALEPDLSQNVYTCLSKYRKDASLNLCHNLIYYYGINVLLYIFFSYINIFHEI